MTTNTEVCSDRYGPVDDSRISAGNKLSLVYTTRMVHKTDNRKYRAFKYV